MADSWNGRAVLLALLLSPAACSSQATGPAPPPAAAPVRPEPAAEASASPPGTAAAPRPRGLVKIPGTLIVIAVLVEFAPSTAIMEGSSDALDKLAAAMIERRWLVEVEGRVDAGELPELALARAATVIEALLSRGVDARQLIAVDRGTDAQRHGPQNIVTFSVVHVNEEPVDAFDPKQNPRAKDGTSGP
jgi:hypothetical protein